MQPFLKNKQSHIKGKKLLTFYPKISLGLLSHLSVITVYEPSWYRNRVYCTPFSFLSTSQLAFGDYGRFLQGPNNQQIYNHCHRLPSYYFFLWILTGKAQADSQECSNFLYLTHGGPQGSLGGSKFSKASLLAEMAQ